MGTQPKTTTQFIFLAHRLPMCLALSHRVGVDDDGEASRRHTVRDDPETTFNLPPLVDYLVAIYKF